MFKVGFLQNNPKILKVRENIDTCLSLIRGKEADLWVFPEGDSLQRPVPRPADALLFHRLKYFRFSVDNQYLTFLSCINY